MNGRVLVSDFDFTLPPHLVARQPADPRDSARLLVHDRSIGRTVHAVFRDLCEFVREGDLLVVNDTRVRPWRLRGVRPTGGACECLVLRFEPVAPALGLAEGFVKPSNKLRVGTVLTMEHGALQLTMQEALGAGRWRFEVAAADVATALDRCGRAPLPPYIPRDGAEDVARDRERYQTVFADKPGAVAAPTAGLHFTPALLERLRASGVALATVTLHVGEGTFAPLRSEVVEEHDMHAEAYELSAATAVAVAAARARGGRVIAVGTTSCRTLETCAGPGRTVVPGSGESSLFLYPGVEFRVVDALLTNFHLPRSTLLMLVAAFAGRSEVLELYREAIEREYRFYSFGDAMLIL